MSSRLLHVFRFVCHRFLIILTCLRDHLVLKMIANILPQDKKHVVGGTVEVNGVDSGDEDIVWSVSISILTIILAFFLAPISNSAQFSTHDSDRMLYLMLIRLIDSMDT